ncbi:hypothetical protein AVEN_123871-1 [Araneus ventricosus]|uniref:Uncharacterized protein n=1 Tax=Araneus ventricosus TaxID=182803 RepID=A0A4Y2GEQ8_ARAVE|nr:hypothetical protein AVEN_123871-1 [Araneus ventricosus]
MQKQGNKVTLELSAVRRTEKSELLKNNKETGQTYHLFLPKSTSIGGVFTKSDPKEKKKQAFSQISHKKLLAAVRLVPRGNLGFIAKRNAKFSRRLP